jgi:hypothetical protein
VSSSTSTDGIDNNIDSKKGQRGDFDSTWRQKASGEMFHRDTITYRARSLVGGAKVEIQIVVQVFNLDTTKRI